MRDEYDFGRAGTAAALSGAGSAALQGAGDAAMAAFASLPSSVISKVSICKGVNERRGLDNVEANIGRIDRTCAAC